MVIWRPPGADWLGALAGIEWPDGNEDKMWSNADAWRKAASDLRALNKDIDAAKSAVRSAYPSGDGGTQMLGELDKLRYGKTSVEELAGWFDKVATGADGMGNELEYSKLMFHSSLLLLGAEIAAAWIFPPTAPAVEAAAIAATRVGARILTRRVLAMMTRQGLKAAGAAAAKFALRHAALDTALGTAQELGIQGYQDLFGRRDGIDWKQVGITAASSAAGALVAGPLGGKLGNSLSKPLVGAFGPKLGRAAANGLSGTLAGPVGAVAGWGAAGVLNGGDFGEFDWRMLTAGAAGGGLSGGVGGYRMKGGGAPPGGGPPPGGGAPPEAVPLANNSSDGSTPPPDSSMASPISDSSAPPPTAGDTPSPGGERPAPRAGAAEQPVAPAAAEPGSTGTHDQPVAGPSSEPPRTAADTETTPAADAPPPGQDAPPRSAADTESTPTTDAPPPSQDTTPTRAETAESPTSTTEAPADSQQSSTTNKDSTTPSDHATPIADQSPADRTGGPEHQQAVPARAETPTPPSQPLNTPVTDSTTPPPRVADPVGPTPHPEGQSPTNNTPNNTEAPPPTHPATTPTSPSAAGQPTHTTPAGTTSNDAPIRSGDSSTPRPPGSPTDARTPASAPPPNTPAPQVGSPGNPEPRAGAAPRSPGTGESPAPATARSTGIEPTPARNTSDVDSQTTHPGEDHAPAHPEDPGTQPGDDNPYRRDPRFSHIEDVLPPDPSRPHVLETLDRDRCTFDGDLITHVDGQPIDAYVRDLLTDRAKFIQAGIEDGSLIPPEIHNNPNRSDLKWANKNIVCVAVSPDPRTGAIYESINGSPDHVIDPDNAHQVMRDRQAEIFGNPQPDGSRPGYIQPDRGSDPPGQPMHNRNGEEIRLDYHLRDEPFRHAEVKNINQILVDRGVPADISPEALDRVLSELMVDVAFVPTRHGASFPNFANCCAMCTRMIDGVPSATGKLTEAPAHPDFRELPPWTRHYEEQVPGTSEEQVPETPHEPIPEISREQVPEARTPWQRIYEERAHEEREDRDDEDQEVMPR